MDDWIATSPITKDAQAVELNVGGDPVGGMPKKIYADNIMVCGDAAGQVNPLTGGGIISGMTGGMYAGQVAAEGDTLIKAFTSWVVETFEKSTSTNSCAILSRSSSFKPSI